MDMRLKNVRDRHAGFTRRLNVNIAVRARVKYRCDSFIIIAEQIGKLSDPFGLNGFKNERHRRQSNAKQLQTSIRSTLQSKLWGAQAASLLFSAVCRKALERSSRKLFCNVGVSSASCRRLQVRHGESVLWRTGALCSPEDSPHLDRNRQQMVDHVSTAIA